MSLRILSYNIHRCIGIDDKYMPERIGRIIVDLDPDVVALQEVQTFHEGADDLLVYFKNNTSYRIILGKTMSFDDSSYGNVMLIKANHCNYTQRTANISVRGREPRSLIDLEFEWNKKQISCIGTHLGLKPFERRIQTRKILEYISKKEKQDVILLCGDINEWFLWGRPLRWLHKHFKRSFSPATFPTSFPILSLDRIWGIPSDAIKKVHVHKNSVTRVASDHYPIFADLV